jgi:hypothetical protein
VLLSSQVILSPKITLQVFLPVGDFFGWGIFLLVYICLVKKEWYSLRRFLKIYRGVVYPVQVCSFPTFLIKKEPHAG